MQMRLEVQSVVERGDEVVVRFVETGCWVAPFQGRDHFTGQHYQVPAIEWFQIDRHGRIAARWGARDSAAIARQVGID